MKIYLNIQLAENMLFYTLVILDIIITVKSLPCALPIRQVYSSIDSDANLQFHADLTNIDSPRKFEIKFHDGSLKARIIYNKDRSTTTDAIPGVNVTGDTAGKVVFTLTKVQQNNIGIYTLASAGFKTKCNCLYILGTPVKPRVTANQTPSVGESVTLTCSSTSTTTPNNHSLSLYYDWRVDNIENPGGSKYSYTPYRKKLTVSNIIRDDANKQFKCTATENVYDEYTSNSSDQFSFDVYYGPDNLEFTPNNTSYEKVENDSLNQVTCTAICYPECRYTWIKIDENINVNSTAILNLVRLQSSDAGTYRCTATRNGGSPKSKDLTVNVIYGPYLSSTHLLPSTKHYTENEGRNINNITCFADCNPSCIYKWSKTRQGQVKAVSNGSGVLSLGILHRDDTALYTCAAKNPGKISSPTTTKQLEVNVRYGPDSAKINKMSPYTITEGDTNVRIECISECYPDCSYKWTHISSSSIISSNRTLHLDNVAREFAGNYKCIVTNSATSDYSKSAESTLKVIIHYKPTITTFAVNGKKNTSLVTVNENENVTFIGIIDSNPNSTVEIAFDGEVIYRESNTNSVFFHHKASCLDAGIYTCYVRNPYNDGNEASAKLELRVRCSPRPLRQMKMNFTSSMNDTVTITFTTLAYPEPGINGFDWYKQNSFTWIPLFSNTDLIITSSGLKTSLTIKWVFTSDFGHYRVTVTNDIGKYDQYLYLVEQKEHSSTEIITDFDKIGQQSDNTGLIVSLTLLAVLFAVVTLYAIILTIYLKRKLILKGTHISASAKQTTYANLSYQIEDPTKPYCRPSSGVTTAGLDQENDDSTQHYTDLVHCSNYDQKTYDVIQKA